MAQVQSPTFAELLRRYRVVAGLTQESLAERAGLAARTISDLERGVASRPRRETLRLLTDALGLSDRDRSRLAAAGDDRREHTAAPALHPLIGRVAESKVLERHVNDEYSALFMLAGEPGIGKTRLLQEVQRHGVMAGMAILQGGCQRRSTQEPFAPLTGAIARSIETLAPPDRRVHLHRCSWLVHLLPELADILGSRSGSVPAEHERRLMFGSVLRYLHNIAPPAGVLLILDDLQWAGADAFDLLAMLVRSANDIPLRVVGAYRNTDVKPGDPLSSFLADLGRPDLVKHLALTPLNALDSSMLLEGLLADRIDKTIEERIVQRAGGVPFFLVSCAEAVRSGSLADEVPWDLAQSVHQRVAALPVGAQQVLRVAALAGRVVPRSLLTAVGDEPEDEILAGLDAAYSAGLLIDITGYTFQFVHDVIREAIETSVAPGYRILVHRRIGGWLASLSDVKRHAAEIAWHFQQSGDSERALPYALLAGDQAEMQFAHADAEQHYRRALGLARDPAVRPGLRFATETEALEKLGATLATLARLDEALQVFEQAVTIYHARDDLESQGRVLAQIASVYFLRGTEEEGVTRLCPMLDLLRQVGPSPALARLHIAQARLLYGLGRSLESLHHALQGIEAATGCGDDESLVLAGHLHGQSLLSLRRLDEALLTYKEIIPRFAEARNRAELSEALIELAFVYDARGELDEGRVHLERALQLAREMEDPILVTAVLEALAWNLVIVGQWNDVRSCLEEMGSILRPLGRSRRSGYPLFLQAELALRQGRVVDAGQYLEEAMERHGKIHNIAQTVQFMRARLDLLAGRPEAALLPLRSQVEESEPNPDLTLLPHLAEAYLGVRDVVRGEELVTRAIEWSREVQDRRTLLEALRVQGLILMNQGCPTEARRTLEEALSLTRSIGLPWEEGRVLLLVADTHASTGEHRWACERRKEAHAIFERLATVQ